MQVVATFSDGSTVVRTRGPHPRKTLTHAWRVVFYGRNSLQLTRTGFSTSAVQAEINARKECPLARILTFEVVEVGAAQQAA